MGIPSTLFCCLYRLIGLKLTEKQVQKLIKFKKPKDFESEYNSFMFVKAVGFLFIRFLSPPEQLYERLSPFLLEVSEKLYQIEDLNQPSNISDFIKTLLGDKSFGSLVLPRVPVLIDRKIQEFLILLPERQRK